MQEISQYRGTNYGWRPARDFRFAARLSTVALAASEISSVARRIPVLFEKHEGKWRAVAVMGPLHGTNLFVSSVGAWEGGFVPATLRAYPFALCEDGALGFWEEYNPELRAAEGVEPLFAEDALAEPVAKTDRFLRTLEQAVEAVDAPLKKLEEAGALVPWSVPGIDNPISESTISGLFALNPDVISRLPDPFVLLLFRTGVLRWLYAHIDSLHHARGFKDMARNRIFVGFEAPKKPEKIDQAADLILAISDDLGDVELCF